MTATSFRVAVGGFLHETNTFGPSRADYAAFEHGGGWPGLTEGNALIEATRDVNQGICGFVAAAEKRAWSLRPTLWCYAGPSAQVTREAFETICGRLIERIRKAGRLDAVYLDLHGAMVAEHVDDGEGEILARVRQIVGSNVPLVASLDLHANVTPRMVDAADALIAYRTYPHVDMADTGRRAAAHLSFLLAGGRCCKAYRQLPFLIPIAWQCTELEPNKTIYAHLRRLETGGVRSASFLCGFPAADFPDCGPSIVAYADTQAAANAVADTLYRRVLAAEGAFAGTSYEPRLGVAEAIRVAKQATRPVVIADTQDNPGAGGDSDTTGMLRALVDANAKRSAIGVIVDPEAARAAHRAGVGAVIQSALGGKSAIAGDAPFCAEFEVLSLSDGNFVASGPFYGGARMRLGLSACLGIGNVRIVVASYKAQMADQAMYRFVGIEPAEQAILVNKSSVHFRADFEPIAASILVCTAPGPMPLSPTDLSFNKLRKGVRLAPNGPIFG